MAKTSKGVRVGSGYIEIRPEFDSNFNRDVEAKLQERLPAAGDKVGKETGDKIGDGIKTNVEKKAGGIEWGKLFAGGAAVFGGAALIGKSAVDAFSDLNESQNKAQVVFGESYNSVAAFADGSAKKLGMSKQAAIEATATYGNLFTAMGLGQDESAGLSTNLVQLASDLASFNNADPTETMEALRSGLTGEVEPLRRFGVNLNQARIEAEALSLGLVKGNVNMVDVQSKTIAVEKAQAAMNAAVKKSGPNSIEARDATAAFAKAQQDLQKITAGQVPELTAAQKAQAAYSIVMKDTTTAQGDYARTADGLANKQRTVNAEFEDAKAALGEQLAPVATTVLGFLSDKLTEISSWWSKPDGGQAMVADFKAGLVVVQEWWTKNMVPLWEGFQAKLDNLFGKTWDERKDNFIKGLGVVKDWWNKNLVPLWEKFQAILDQAFGKTWDERVASFNAGWDKIKKAIDPVVGTVQDLNDKLQAMSKFWDDLPGPVKQLLSLGAGVGGIVASTSSGPNGPSLWDIGKNASGIGPIMTALSNMGDSANVPTRPFSAPSIKGGGVTSPLGGGTGGPAVNVENLHITTVPGGERDAFGSVRSELRKTAFLAGGV